MKDDTIKKSDVIDAVKIILHRFDYREYSIGFKWAMSVIETLPSADRPQEWIPCSERLPSWGDSYCLVTYKTKHEVGVSIDCWDDEGKNWCDHYRGDGGEVIAWMPLPKPWKGADDDR